MENLSRKGIIIAFGELFLKSKGVKKLFIKKLVWNLAHFLKKSGIIFKIRDLRDRIFVETDQTQKAIKTIKKVFGISWLAEALYFGGEADERTCPVATGMPRRLRRGGVHFPEANLKEFSKFAAENYKDWIKSKETFAIRLKSDIKEEKKKIIDKIAENIDRKVDLSYPDKEIFIEMRKAGTFLYFKKVKGAGGLPTGSSGKVLTLVSGGIDSPVASYLMAKRGAESVWLHFHSYPLVSNKSIEKVKDLAIAFLEYQPRLKVYFVPFQRAQLEIKTKTPQNQRILLYRRLMFRIAELIAEKENCHTLATGESLGQVSSQTLPNIKIIEEAVKIPVLRPLIGMDKEEIIELAEKIGTFKISIKPQEDCCTLFVPKHASAQGDIKKIKEFEKKINSDKTIKEIIKGIKVVTF